MCESVGSYEATLAQSIIFKSITEGKREISVDAVTGNVGGQAITLERGFVR